MAQKARSDMDFPEWHRRNDYGLGWNLGRSLERARKYDMFGFVISYGGLILHFSAVCKMVCTGIASFLCSIQQWLVARETYNNSPWSQPPVGILKLRRAEKLLLCRSGILQQGGGKWIWCFHWNRVWYLPFLCLSRKKCKDVPHAHCYFSRKFTCPLMVHPWTKWRASEFLGGRSSIIQSALPKSRWWFFVMFLEFSLGANRPPFFECFFAFC